MVTRKQYCVPLAHVQAKRHTLHFIGLTRSCDIVTGWLTLFSGGPLAPVLHEVQLELVDSAICQHVLRMLKPGHKHLTVLCAGPEEGGKDACQVVIPPPLGNLDPPPPHCVHPEGDEGKVGPS